MGCKAGDTVQVAPLQFLPVTSADIGTVTVVGKVLTQEGVTTNNITAGLQIAVSGQALPDLVEPPGTVLITGLVFDRIQVVALFKSIAPEVMLDRLKAVLSAQHIDRILHKLPDILAAHIQNAESGAVVEIHKPVGRFVLEQLGKLGSLQADPQGGSQTDLTDTVCHRTQTVREFFRMDTLGTLVGNTHTDGIPGICMIAIVQLNPAHSGEIVLQELGFLKDHFLGYCAVNTVIPSTPNQVVSVDLGSAVVGRQLGAQNLGILFKNLFNIAGFLGSAQIPLIIQHAAGLHIQAVGSLEGGVNSQIDGICLMLYGIIMVEHLLA